MSSLISHFNIGSEMAHCPYCLTTLSERDFLCHTCGAEKGYLYFNRKSRGLAFLLMIGLLAPLAAILAVPLYFQDLGIPFWMVVAAAIGLGIFTVHRLVVGPIWYR